MQLRSSEHRLRVAWDHDLHGSREEATVVCCAALPGSASAAPTPRTRDGSRKEEDDDAQDRAQSQV